MKRDTKQIILGAALKLFNETGYVNVRLQHIADEASISIGNLTYHFKQKLEILTAICKQIQELQVNLWIDLQEAPIFEYFDQFLRKTYQLQQDYSFYYLDVLEIIRASEKLANQYREHNAQQEQQLNFLVQSYIARGALNDIEEIDTISDLSHRLRNQIDLWMLSNWIEGKKESSLDQFAKEVWLVLIPYMTTTGILEYSNLKIKI